MKARSTSTKKAKVTRSQRQAVFKQGHLQDRIQLAAQSYVFQGGQALES
jgi:hypothetical protein